MVTKISWEDIEKAVDEIAAKINQTDFKADYIIGIATGGLVPLGLLDKKLGIKNVLTITARSYTGEKQGQLNVSYLPEIDLRGKKILLVDELADTGETLGQISQLLVEKYQPLQLKTATLAINKKNCKLLPDFFVIGSENFVVFPWEKDEFPQHF